MRVTRAVALSAALVITAYIGRWAALQSTAAPANPVVIDRQFGALVLGIMFATSVLATMLLIKPGTANPKVVGSPLHRWILTIGSLLSIVGVAIAVAPQIQLPAQMTLVFPPTATVVVPPIHVDHPVYYENGGRRLDSDQTRVLGRFFDALATCDGVRVTVSAFASSAPFSKDPVNDKNVALANARAEEIRLIGGAHGMRNIDATKWENYDSMVRARGVRDMDGSGQRLKIRELLNRRADIGVTLPSQCVH